MLLYVADHTVLVSENAFVQFPSDIKNILPSSRGVNQSTIYHDSINSMLSLLLLDLGFLNNGIEPSEYQHV